MNTQERETLTRLLDQLTLAQVAQKDAEAEALIKAACARQPDAAYLLVQRSLLQELALQNAQAQITALQTELERARPAPRGGFLDANSWGSVGTTGALGNVNRPAAFSAAAMPASMPGSTGSSLLGTIATTAAGVVAGSFLFQGIEHLLGNHGGVGGNSHLMDRGTGLDSQLNVDAGNEFEALAAADDAGATDGSDDWI